MTAVRRDAGADTELMLVCDQCGTALRARNTPIRAFALVWSAARDIGWKGVRRAVGPHKCPQCAGAAAVPRPVVDD